MSDSFTVDVVATPHLDLCGATARDMQYREANGKYPAASRSAVAKEQEKLNKFLQYVNESFIIKGFSKASVQARSPVRGYTSGNTAPALVKETPEILCDFDLSHGENAQILVLFSITGNGASNPGSQAVLTCVIKENGTAAATFAQKLDGASTISAPFLLINREKGVTNIGVEASVSGGEIAVARYGAFASALVLE